MLYMVTFTINIPQILAYIPFMDPMGYRLQFSIAMLNYRSRLPGCSGGLAHCYEMGTNQWLITH
jgi:hypothetical protein